MKKELVKTITGVTGAALLLSGCAATANNAAAVPEKPAAEADAVFETSLEESAIGIEARAAESYATIADVQGEFKFNQNVLSPADDVFNLFGTAVTAACAKPGFAFGEVDEEVYYVNVKGAVKKAYSMSLEQLKEQQNSVSRIMKCSCASSSAIANAKITGVSVNELLDMAGVEEAANAVTFRSGDGYGVTMPLQYVLDREALLVYSLDGANLTAERGGQLQVWMPDTVAKYFTRQVTEIELSVEDEEPALVTANAGQRAKVSIVNRFEEAFKVGDQITFEGYADDFDVQVAAVEFSLDGGATWTSYDTSASTTDKWVYWSFGYTADAPGTYEMQVRARTADGGVSPLASSVVFTVQ